MTTLRENIVWKDIAATPAAFTLHGGRYDLVAHAGAWGTADLQVLADDGSTYLSVLSGATPLSADGVQALDLANGNYRLALAGVTALSASLRSIYVPVF